MIPPACCEVVRDSEWRAAESWRDAEEGTAAKDSQTRLNFIEWLVEEGLICSEESFGAIDLEQEFERLANDWRERTINLSSMAKMTHLPAYRKIIELGPRVVPLLLRKLKENQGMWFLALAEVSGQSPVRSEHAGNVKKIREAWLDWGREKGYL
jgi:hypothetical protein